MLLLSLSLLFHSPTLPGGGPDRTAELYAEHCAGCHGPGGREFRNRTDWMYGGSADEVRRSIAEGIAEEGMAGFSGVLTAGEVDALAAWVMDVPGGYVAAIGAGDAGGVRLDTVVAGLEVPFGLAELPDGSWLVMERPGRLVHAVDGVVRAVDGVPGDVMARGQGGFTDVAVWEGAGAVWVYLTWSKVHPDDDRLSTTALGRGRWNAGARRLDGFEELFVAEPWSRNRHHYGGRIAFDGAGYLYLTVGDRGEEDRFPADSAEGPGKVHRLFPDGQIPGDNPWKGADGRPLSAYSRGHRNPQGLTVHPGTGAVWTHEHGPKGGDEINIPVAGGDCGWPRTTYGRNYNGTEISEFTTLPGIRTPLHYWLPSIGPSGMAFIAGGGWPDARQGALLVGSLRFEYLELLKLDGEQVVARERLLDGVGRVRSVVRGRDGTVYVAIERPGTDGFVARVVPLPR